MLRISRKTDYGLVLMAYLAKQYPNDVVSLQKIAGANHLPLPFLRQLAMALHRAGLIESREGFRGGYRLTKDPAQITVSQIVSVFEKNISPVVCLENPGTCKAEDVCTTQKVWQTLYGDMLKTFNNTTLQSFL